ncbi:hypothetical protein [Cognatiluteimonas weifangensis]|uniref:DUF3619 family protein n=1 Tax=Cognatiluteimonas weifangensis TaxID=2303539 RepID=A0A372DK55_9GAMM|nr:hypothetical protein [Luteimonas weifangensis]RFP59837.1 hypothetical protein D0Y53_10035 [Luteimonas weifangensis]
MNEHTPPQPGRDLDAPAVDRAARAHHRQALAALSPRARAQLHHRLQAALAGEVRAQPPRMPAWSWGAAAALVLALAFGLRGPGTPDPAPGVGLPLATQPAAVDTAPATLDQDPDFYLWLASRDAVTLASE